MKRAITIILTIGISIFTIKVGDILLRERYEGHSAKKQVESLNLSLEGFQRENEDELKLPSICANQQLAEDDTLKYKRKESEEFGERYHAEFQYVLFLNNEFLNKEIKFLVFDGFDNPKRYKNHYLDEYQIAFKDAKDDDKYGWSDLEIIDIQYNTRYIVSFTHHDIEWKVGGAIGFGDRIGYNFDLKTKKRLQFEDVIDTNKIEIVKNALIKSYKGAFKFNNLVEGGWDKEEIPITKNICLMKEGIAFIYQRFEESNFPRGIEILVPYCELGAAIKPNTILSKHLK